MTGVAGIQITAGHRKAVPLGRTVSEIDTTPSLIQSQTAPADASEAPGFTLIIYPLSLYSPVPGIIGCPASASAPLAPRGSIVAALEHYQRHLKSPPGNNNEMSLPYKLENALNRALAPDTRSSRLLAERSTAFSCTRVLGRARAAYGRFPRFVFFFRGGPSHALGRGFKSSLFPRRPDSFPAWRLFFRPRGGTGPARFRVL